MESEERTNCKLIIKSIFTIEFISRFVALELLCEFFSFRFLFSLFRGWILEFNLICWQGSFFSRSLQNFFICIFAVIFIFSCSAEFSFCPKLVAFGQIQWPSNNFKKLASLKLLANHSFSFWSCFCYQNLQLFNRYSSEPSNLPLQLLQLMIFFFLRLTVKSCFHKSFHFLLSTFPFIFLFAG